VSSCSASESSVADSCSSRYRIFCSVCVSVSMARLASYFCDATQAASSPQLRHRLGGVLGLTKKNTLRRSERLTASQRGDPAARLWMSRCDCQPAATSTCGRVEEEAGGHCGGQTQKCIDGCVFGATPVAYLQNVLTNLRLTKYWHSSLARGLRCSLVELPFCACWSILSVSGSSRSLSEFVHQRNNLPIQLMSHLLSL